MKNLKILNPLNILPKIKTKTDFYEGDNDIAFNEKNINMIGFPIIYIMLIILIVMWVSKANTIQTNNCDDTTKSTIVNSCQPTNNISRCR